MHYEYHICVCVRARGSQMHRSIVLHLDDNHIQMCNVQTYCHVKQPEQEPRCQTCSVSSPLEETV